MRHILFVLSLALVPSCGALNSTGHCDFRPKQDRCQERDGVATTLVAFQQLCGPSGGTYGSDACPRAGVIGGCDLSEAGNPVRDWYYTDASKGITTADQVKAMCNGQPCLSP